MFCSITLGRPKMKVPRSTWIFTATCFIPLCAFAIRPNAWLQLGSMVCFVVALFWCAILVVLGAAKWRERAVGNLVSCLMIVAAFPIAVFCGQTIRSAVFLHDLDRWNQAVKWVVTHNTPNQPRLIQLPPEYSDLADGVGYTHDGTCGLMIDFFWGEGWPVKHTVRRYAINPKWADIMQCREDWSSGSALSGNWYEISD
jgi:hypothetical protein